MIVITATTTLQLLCINKINHVESTECACFIYCIWFVKCECERLVDDVSGVSSAIDGFMLEIGTRKSGL
jgi:hypothetical protein